MLCPLTPSALSVNTNKNNRFIFTCVTGAGRHYGGVIVSDCHRIHRVDGRGPPFYWAPGGHAYRGPDWSRLIPGSGAFSLQTVVHRLDVGHRLSPLIITAVFLILFLNKVST